MAFFRMPVTRIIFSQQVYPTFKCNRKHFKGTFSKFMYVIRYTSTERLKVFKEELA